MSNPLSLTAQFRTYSYHHILIACSTSGAAEAVQEANDILLFEKSALGDERYEPLPIGDGFYTTIINGTQDSEFTIQRAEWSSILSPAFNDADGMQRSSVVFVEGTMQIIEPMGIRFMNILSQVARGFGTDPTTVIYVLKTIFVGHTDSGGTVPIDVRIRPLTLFIYDITGSFDIQGGLYEISFTGQVNGTSRTHWATQGLEGLTLKIQSGEELGPLFERLSGEVNRKYEETVDELIATINKKKGRSGASEIEISRNDFKRMEYIIETPDFEEGGYADYSISGISLKQQDHKERDTPQLAFGPNPSLESVIFSILEHSSEIMEEGRKEETRIMLDDSGRGGPVIIEQSGKYIPTISTKVDVTPDKVIVTATVLRKFTPLTSPSKAFVDEEGNATRRFATNREIEENTLVLNYFFTGENVDIINFDIKMNLGIAFFQTLLTSDNIPQEADAVSGSNQRKGRTVDGATGSIGGAGNASISEATQRGEQPANNSGTQYRRLLPPAITLKDAKARNKLKPVQAASYKSLFERHAAYESIEAKVLIHGIPQLLGDVSRLPLSDEEETEGVIVPRWQASPAFCKLNIRMPRSYGLSAEPSIETQYSELSEPFWYQGLFIIIGVKNSFEGGLFTQELDLISKPIYDPALSEFSDEDTEEEQQQKQDTTCPQKVKEVQSDPNLLPDNVRKRLTSVLEDFRRQRAELFEIRKTRDLTDEEQERLDQVLRKIKSTGRAIRRLPPSQREGRFGRNETNKVKQKQNDLANKEVEDCGQGTDEEPEDVAATEAFAEVGGA